MPDQTPDDVRSYPFRYTRPGEIVARLRNPLMTMEIGFSGSGHAAVDPTDAECVRIAAAGLIERQAQEIERAKQLLAGAEGTVQAMHDAHAQAIFQCHERIREQEARLWAMPGSARDAPMGNNATDKLAEAPRLAIIEAQDGIIQAQHARIHELEAMNREQKNMLREQARAKAPEWAEPSWLPHMDALIKREHELSLRPEHPRFTLDVRRMAYEAQCPVTA